jgi:hypothetical protein
MDLSSLKNTPPWEWPEDAGTTLLAAFADRTTPLPDRMAAATLAGDATVVNDELAGALLRIVGDEGEPSDLRCAAAVALGPALELMDEWDPDDLDEPVLSLDVTQTIKQTFRRLYADAAVPGDVRRRVLEAAVRAPEEWHHGAVRAAWLGDDPAWRVTAIFCMRFLPGFGDRILEALDSPEAEIRYQAIRASENWALKGAWSRVVRVAKDERGEKDLRLAAIAAIGAIRPSAARGVLGALTVSRDEDIADAALEAVTMAEAEGEPELEE